jgi:hypothetical protein
MVSIEFANLNMKAKHAWVEYIPLFNMLALLVWKCCCCCYCLPAVHSALAACIFPSFQCFKQRLQSTSPMLISAAWYCADRSCCIIVYCHSTAIGEECPAVGPYFRAGIADIIDVESDVLITVAAAAAAAIAATARLSARSAPLPVPASEQALPT